MTNYDPFGFAQDRFNICYFGAARDNYEVRNEDYGFCSIYGEAFDATGVVLGKDAKIFLMRQIELKCCGK